MFNFFCSSRDAMIFDYSNPHTLPPHQSDQNISRHLVDIINHEVDEKENL